MKGTGWEEKGKETTDVGTTLARRTRGGWGKASPEPRGAGSPAETLVRAGTYVHCATIPWLLLLWSFSKCTRDVLGTEPSPFEWVSVCSAPARADLHHFLPACLCKKEPSNRGLSNPGRKTCYFTCALIYASKWKLVLTFATGVHQVFCDQTGFLCSENGDSSPARARAGQTSYFKKNGPA